MSITIVPYTAEHIDAVRKFNSRIEAAGWGNFQLPPDLCEFEASRMTPLPSEGWLAIADGTVRGGYLLRHQQFSFRGEMRKTSFYSLSISEGVVDRAYGIVGLRMVRSAVAREPWVFGLGMGGQDRPLPRLLKGLGWDLFDVPFYFYCVNPAKVARNIQTVRTSTSRRVLLDGAAYSGVVSLGVHTMQWFRRARGGRIGRLQLEPVPRFDAWADDVWTSAHASFAMIGDRRSEALNTVYPASHQRLVRLKLLRDGRAIGWAVVMLTQMRQHRQFGNLRVGTIVDGLSVLDDSPSVVETARHYLQEQGAEVIISNQSHKAWCGALERCGFLRGPSNYVLGVSKELSRLLSPFTQNVGEAHINRGDGDGPIHL